MNKELKPTWNYILNDLALYSLFIKVAYSENVTHQDKIDLEHQIKLLQQKVNQLEKEVERLKEREKLVTEHYDVMVRHSGNLEGKIIQLETNRDKAYKLLDDIDEYMLVEQHLKLVEAKKLLERGNSNE